MIKSKILFLSNNLNLIAFSVLVVLISLSNYYFIIPGIIYFNWLRRHKIFDICVIVSLIIGFMFLYYINYLPEIDRECLVIESDESKSVCRGNTKYIIYESYDVGDVLYINGDFFEPGEASSPYTFNYKNYVKTKGIYYLVYTPDAEFLYKKRTIYDVREYVKGYFDTFPILNKSYLSALIIGDKSLINEEIVESMVDVGIIHLFAISGLHVGLITIILKRILELFMNENDIDDCLLVFLSFYMIVAGFSVSVVRASLMFIFSIFNKRLRLPFSSLDILSFTFILFLFINPLYILDIGFQLSFIVTMFLILGFKIVEGDLIKQSFYVSLLAQLATLPIIINLNNQVNLLSVIFNIVFVLLMSYILLPVTFASFLFKFLNNLYSELIYIFERLVNLFDEASIIIKVANIHIILIVVYYFLLYIYLVNLEYNKIYKCFYLVTLVIVIPYLNPIDSVYFIDVGQGDSTLFKSRFNSCNVLVDTGGKLKSNITNNNVVPVLSSIGSFKIDYLVLTHSHFDHAGGAKTIIDTFNVKNLVISRYNTGNLINVVREYAKKKGVKILEVKPGDYIGCSNEFRVIGPNKYYESINNQSIVLDVDFANKKWLLMGDSEVKDFFVRDIDILKLGHHGSKTSLTVPLLKKLNPELGIISSGVNSYGLPSPEVLDILESNSVDIYRTDNVHTLQYLNIGSGIILTTNSYNIIVLGKPKYL